MSPIGPSGGGGGNTTAQTAASGKVLPVANTAVVTVDSTTYDDPIAGGGAKLTTLVFGSDQGALAIALLGDLFPRWLLASDAGDGFYFGSGAVDPYGSSGSSLSVSGDGTVHLNVPSGKALVVGGKVSPATAASGLNAPKLAQISPQFTITSGALPAATIVSGTGIQIDVATDRETHTPVTFNPGVATTATCTVALSPDNTTYTTLCVITKPVGTVFDGEIEDVSVRVPGGWYIKLTVVNATIGATTYY